MSDGNNIFKEFTDILLPLVQQGHKIAVINSGPTFNGAHLLHPDTIKLGVGAGNLFIILISVITLLLTVNEYNNYYPNMDLIELVFQLY